MGRGKEGGGGRGTDNSLRSCYELNETAVYRLVLICCVLSMLRCFSCRRDVAEEVDPGERASFMNLQGASHDLFSAPPQHLRPQKFSIHKRGCSICGGMCVEAGISPVRYYLLPRQTNKCLPIWDLPIETYF